MVHPLDNPFNDIRNGTPTNYPGVKPWKKCTLCRIDLVPMNATQAKIDRGGRCRDCDRKYQQHRKALKEAKAAGYIEPNKGPKTVTFESTQWLNFSACVYSYCDESVEPEQLLLHLMNKYIDDHGGPIRNPDGTSVKRPDSTLELTESNPDTPAETGETDPSTF